MQYGYSQIAIKHQLIFEPQIYKLKKEPEVLEAGEGQSTKWMGDLVLLCGSGIPRFCKTVKVESTKIYRNYNKQK